MITDFFIDGTVAGTDVATGNIDDSGNKDHTYYGNGCPNAWDSSDPPSYGGSDKACSTRIARTRDNEEQKNGTYYHFQAATSGTGGAIETDNTNSSDTFCPLGWQLPYSGTGGDYYDKSRSWKYLFDTYGYQESGGSGSRIQEYPISYFFSGSYFWRNGRLFYLGNVASQSWSSTSGSHIINAYRMGWSNVGYYFGLAGKNDGYPIRCGFMVSILTYVYNWLILKT